MAVGMSRNDLSEALFTLCMTLICGCMLFCLVAVGFEAGIF